MKITLVGQDLLMTGGVQYATAAMARALSERGFEVEVLVSQYHVECLSKGIKAFALPECVKLIVMPERSGHGNIRFLRQYLKTTDAKCVVAESGIYIRALRIASFGLWRRPKLAQVWHGDTPSSRVWQNKMRRMLEYAILYSGVDYLLTVNEHIGKGVLKYTHAIKTDHVSTVYNPVVDDEFRRKAAGATTHPWLTNKQGPTFVAAGACDWNKGHFMLIKAIERANARLNDDKKIRLVIFGDGVKREEMLAYIKEHRLQNYIDMPGLTTNLPAELKAADCFVLGTHVESFAIVLVEALACGIPVISTNAPWGPPEVLENGKYGTLVPVDDIEAMAQAMIKVSQEPRTTIPDVAWNRFTVEAITDRYIKALHLGN